MVGGRGHGRRPGNRPGTRPGNRPYSRPGNRPVRPDVSFLPNRHHLGITYKGQPILVMNHMFRNYRVNSGPPVINNYITKKNLTNEQRRYVHYLTSRLTQYISRIRKRELDIFRKFVENLKRTRNHRYRFHANRQEGHKIALSKYALISRTARQPHAIMNNNIQMMNLRRRKALTNENLSNTSFLF